MGMKLDFTGVEGQKSFEPIPGGKYLVEVTDYRQGQASEAAKNPGAPTISWMLTVQETATGETAVVNKRTDEEIKVEGRTLWENMTIVEASLWRLKAFLEACGFETEGEIDFDPEEVLGSQLIVKVGIQKARKDKETGDEYDARNVVRSFHPVGDTE